MEYLNEREDGWTSRFWGKSKSNDEEALRRLAHAIGSEFKIQVNIKPYEEHVAHTDRKTNTITIGTQKLWSRGKDFYVGLLLHEIAHIRFSPRKDDPILKPIHGFKKNKHIAKNVWNMMEDPRIDEKMKLLYGGADIYYSELNGQNIDELAKTYLRVPFEYKTINQYLAMESGIDNTLSLTGGLSNEEFDKTTNGAKRFLFYRTCGLASVIAEYADSFGSTTGVEEADKIAKAVAVEYRKMKNSSLPPEAAVSGAKEVLCLMEKLIPIDDGEDKDDGEGGESDDVIESLDKKTSLQGGGGWHRSSKDPMGISVDGKFLNADTKVKPLVDKMKRKLVATMRENERKKYVGGKKKGILNKKALTKVAHDTFTIYQKRLEAKGKKYAVAIIEDCSGSMWNGGSKKIRSAHEAVALMTRVFRGLGFPTSITIFGSSASMVLDARDIYEPAKVMKKMCLLGGAYYDSGDNEVHKGLNVSLKRLEVVGSGMHKLVIIITDGGLYGPDIEKSRSILKKIKKREDMDAFIFYLEDGTIRLLEDKDNETLIKNVSQELIPEATRLLKKVMGPMQE